MQLFFENKEQNCYIYQSKLTYETNLFLGRVIRAITKQLFKDGLKHI